MLYYFIGSSIDPVLKILNENSMINIEEIEDIKSLYNLTKIFVNGRWFGVHTNPVELFKLLKESKQKAVINIFTSIVFNIDMNEIVIFTDAGRCCRPHIVENKNLKITKSHIHRLENGSYKWKNLLW